MIKPIFSVLTIDRNRDIIYKDNYFNIIKGEFKMSENNGNINLLDLIKALLAKWKLLLCATLAALLLFGGIGAAVSLLSNQNYGADIKFYITSDKSNKYILSLVQSDIFAEELFMDENGLPAEFSNTEKYKTAASYYQRVEELEEEIKLTEKAFDDGHYARLVEDAQRVFNERQKAYDEMFARLDTMLESPDSANYKTQIESAVKELDAAKKAKDEAKKAYNEIYAVHADKKQEIADMNREMEYLREEYVELKDELLADFRAIEKNAEKINKIKESVSYSYSTEEGNESQAVLCASISSRKDQEAAELLIKKIPEKLPIFIEENVSEDAVCDYMSALSVIGKLEINPLISTTVKYGAVGAVATFIILCFGIATMYFVKLEKKSKDIVDIEVK